MTESAAAVDSGSSASVGASTGGGSAPYTGSDSGEARQVAPSGSEAANDNDKPASRERAKPANDNGQAETKAEAALRRKIRRMGQEQEYDFDTLAKLASDDYEYEFTAPGGKNQMKMRLPELIRAAQLSEGAEQRMQQAAQLRKEFEKKIATGRSNPVEFLEMELGLEDAEGWAMQLAQQAYQRDMQLQKLLQSQNPDDRLRYQHELRKMERERLERRAKAQQAAQQREQQAQEQQRRDAERDRILGSEFKARGVPFNRETFEMAEKIVGKYRNAGVPIGFQDLAEMVHKEWIGERSRWLAQMPDEDLLKLLGDERRARLREYEANSVKEARKEQRAAAREETRDERPRTVEKKPLNDRDFMRKWGR